MNDTELLFDPQKGRMNVLVLASGSGTNFEEAYKASLDDDSNYSIRYLITDKERKKGSAEKIGAIQRANKYGVPCTTIPGYRICGSYADAQKGFREYMDYQRRVIEYNQILLDDVDNFERDNEMHFDLMLLAGYMRFVRGALWRRFERKAINVHPADLTVRGDYDIREYTGDDAVKLARDAGEIRTRSSIILVDPEPDAGAILVSGPWADCMTDGWSDSAHQEYQKGVSDWPALKFALKAIAHGELGIHKTIFHSDGNPVIVYRGENMPYGGFEME